jgi:hypothetical protein
MEQDTRSFTTHANMPPQQSMAPVMTIGNWVVTMIIMVIPIVNIIMLIVWAAGTNDNPNRKNWAIAQLIFMAIGIVLWISLFSTMAGVMGGLLNGY